MKNNSLLAPQISSTTVLPGLELFSMPTGSRGMVIIEGSFLGGYMFSPKHNPMIPLVTAMMLDEGTKKRSKHTLHEELENLGATINFSSDTYRVRFEIQCLIEHTDAAIRILAEELRTPRFGEKELERLKHQLTTALEHEKDTTRSAAQTLFRQQVFPPHHPNYRLSPETKIHFIEQITPQDLQKFHSDSYGLGSFIVACVGDVNHESLSNSFVKYFSGWKSSPLTTPSKREIILPGKSAELITTLHEKTSTDIFMGHAIPLTNKHPDYYALSLGNFILGGGATSRLSDYVREKSGLTYGIYSYLGGLNHGESGYIAIWATFAPSLLTRGIESTKKCLLSWYRKGITEEELKTAKKTVSGLYKVGLATGEGLAQAIISTVEQQFPLTYLDEYPTIIQKISLKEINGAIKKYITPQALVEVVAGSVKDDRTPL